MASQPRSEGSIGDAVCGLALSTRMQDRDHILARIAFDTTLIEWRGPAPFVFAPLPDEVLGAVAHAARSASKAGAVCQSRQPSARRASPPR